MRSASPSGQLRASNCAGALLGRVAGRWLAGGRIGRRPPEVASGETEPSGAPDHGTLGTSSSCDGHQQAGHGEPGLVWRSQEDVADMAYCLNTVIGLLSNTGRRPGDSGRPFAFQ